MKMIWKNLDLRCDIEFWIVFVIENSIILQKWFWKENLVG